MSADASTKILGFKYQEMVALVKCLEAGDDETIFLECYGDVSDGKTSTEVKHSIDSSKKLINKHIDFWKTIYNCLDNYELYQFYTTFILHTTANIDDDSIFSGWNDKTSEQKLNGILSVKANDTILKYVKLIHNFNQSDLKKILNKFTILDKQPTAKKYYLDILCQHPSIINAIKEEHRKEFLNSLLGYISTELILSDDYIWQINISSFRENFQSYLNHYQIEDLIFPKSKKTINDANSQKFRFVQELLNIDYHTKVGQAYKNYIKATDSQIMMIKKRKSLSDTLDDFDGEIKESIEDNMISHSDKLRSASNFDIDEKSRRFIEDTEKEVALKKEIIGVRGVQPYYPKGRFYHCFEEDESLSCKLKDNNESK